MPKRFKFRLSRMIPIFQSCRPKDPSNLPINPVPNFLRLPSSPSSSTHSNRHHLPTSDLATSTPTVKPTSSQTISLGCGRRRLRSHTRSNSTTVDNNRTEPPPSPTLKDNFKWDKEEKWHVVAIDFDRRRSKQTYISESDEEEEEEIVVNVPQRLKPRRRRKRTGLIRVRWSTSSADSGGSFSDDESVEELETLITNSTRSGSTTTTNTTTTTTDSSAEFSPHLETIREGQLPPTPQSTPANARRRSKNEISSSTSITTRSTTHPQKKVSTMTSRRKQRIAAAVRGDEDEELEELRSSAICGDHHGLAAPARLSMALQRLVPCGAGAAVVEGKVRDSYAVTKRSEDPYEDFKVSMMEMIVEKEMVDERDLEELLRCFLSLNDKKHHGIILDAFSEIWDDIYRKPVSR